MSFYGDIKRVQSSPFVFDKYYPNRKTMEAQAASDGVYIGRYVLVKYTCKYDENGKISYFDKYVASQNNSADEKQINSNYEANIIEDQQYHDTFDGTVWQKIYTNVTDGTDTRSIEKYIMVAELNSSVPRLEFDIVSPKYYDNEDVEQWNVPSINESTSSEETYHITMPDVLHLGVGDMNEDFYGKTLINPSKRETYDITPPTDPPEGISANDWNNYTTEQKQHILALSPQYNYMRWENLYKDDNGEYQPHGDPRTTSNITSNIDGKQLKTQLYAFGQVISDLYDALYGIPSTGTGPRPFYTDAPQDILSHYDKGLIGILSSIATDIKGDIAVDSEGRRLMPGMHYYFASKWGDCEEDPENFIENIPKVIGSANEFSNNKAYFYIQDWTLTSLAGT